MSARPGTRLQPLGGRLVSPLRVTRTSPEGWQELGTVEPRNGLPESRAYAWRAGDAGRDAEIAAFVAGAHRRALAKRDREDEDVRQIRAAQDN